MVKPTRWVVDMRHYIDEDTGDLPEMIPERVLSLAIFFGAIVAWVTDHSPDGDEHTNVPCRRSPGRRRCRGDIIAKLDSTSGYIVWQCRAVLATTVGMSSLDSSTTNAHRLVEA